MMDPCATKEQFRWFLQKLGEWRELDTLIQDYIRGILGQTIICGPSKGPYGEQGKDIAACEDDVSRCYCSYIIKCGDLSSNLDGKYGVLRQLTDALSIELENRDYQGRPRTAVVAHNGDEGYRGSLARYEIYRRSLEDTLREEGLLLRPVERWDLDRLTEKLFPHCMTLREIERSRQVIDRHFEFADLAREFRKEIDSRRSKGDPDHPVSDSLIRDYTRRYDSLEANCAPALYRQDKRGADDH